MCIYDADLGRAAHGRASSRHAGPRALDPGKPSCAHRARSLPPPGESQVLCADFPFLTVSFSCTMVCACHVVIICIDLPPPSGRSSSPSGAQGPRAAHQRGANHGDGQRGEGRSVGQLQGSVQGAPRSAGKAAHATGNSCTHVERWPEEGAGFFSFLLIARSPV